MASGDDNVQEEPQSEKEIELENTSVKMEREIRDAVNRNRIGVGSYMTRMQMIEGGS